MEKQSIKYLNLTISQDNFFCGFTKDVKCVVVTCSTTIMLSEKYVWQKLNLDTLIQHFFVEFYINYYLKGGIYNFENNLKIM